MSVLVREVVLLFQVWAIDTNGTPILLTTTEHYGHATDVWKKAKANPDYEVAYMDKYKQRRDGTIIQ